MIMKNLDIDEKYSELICNAISKANEQDNIFKTIEESLANYIDNGDWEEHIKGKKTKVELEICNEVILRISFYFADDSIHKIQPSVDEQKMFYTLFNEKRKELISNETHKLIKPILE